MKLNRFGINLDEDRIRQGDILFVIFKTNREDMLAQ